MSPGGKAGARLVKKLGKACEEAVVSQFEIYLPNRWRIDSQILPFSKRICFEARALFVVVWRFWRSQHSSFVQRPSPHGLAVSGQSKFLTIGRPLPCEAYR